MVRSLSLSLSLSISRAAAVAHLNLHDVVATMPIGVPLAGYNHGPRRVPHWPIPEFKKYSNFMTPSQGMMDPSTSLSHQ